MLRWQDYLKVQNSLAAKLIQISQRLILSFLGYTIIRNVGQYLCVLRYMRYCAKGLAKGLVQLSVHTHFVPQFSDNSLIQKNAGHSLAWDYLSVQSFKRAPRYTPSLYNNSLLNVLPKKRANANTLPGNSFAAQRGEFATQLRPNLCMRACSFGQLLIKFNQLCLEICCDNIGQKAFFAPVKKFMTNVVPLQLCHLIKGYDSIAH